MIIFLTSRLVLMSKITLFLIFTFIPFFIFWKAHSLMLGILLVFISHLIYGISEKVLGQPFIFISNKKLF